MKFVQFFKVLNISFKKISIVTFFILVFYEIFIKLRSIFYPLKFFYWNPLWHWLTIQIIYIPISKYHHHSLSCMCYYLLHITILSDTFLLSYLFLTLITFWYQLKDIILFWSFLDVFAILIQEVKEILQDQICIFKTRISKVFQYIN